MNSRHQKTLAFIYSEPVSGNIEWRRIEALFIALGCQIIEGSGSLYTALRKHLFIVLTQVKKR